MGAVHFSVDTGLIAALKKVLPLTTFVETGTFEGDTIQKVLHDFELIHSVELSEDYYRKVVERFKSAANVRLHLGHSADMLRALKPELAGMSVLFWLDAHWCVADKTAGGASQCPLLEELDAIGSLEERSIILIDDARLFLCPPPSPHEISHWPHLHTVVTKLLTLSTSHEIVVTNDVIIFFPASIRATMEQYAYEHSINWLTVLDKSRDYDILLKQLKDKEGMIDTVQQIAEERVREINSLKDIADERAREIQAIKEVAEERSRVINLINDELESIKRHWLYRSMVKAKRALESVHIIRKS